jgi:hypothetical protein
MLDRTDRKGGKIRGCRPANIREVSTCGGRVEHLRELRSDINRKRLELGDRAPAFSLVQLYCKVTHVHQ